MRYFYNYYDDTMNGLARHDSGYLVNRKSTVFSFLKNGSRDTKREKATSTRMANAFVKKLEKGRAS